MPTARDGEGRQLPRAYVARRRAPIRPPRVDLVNPPANSGGTRGPLGGASEVPLDVPSASAQISAPASPPHGDTGYRATSAEATVSNTPVPGRLTRETRASHDAASEAQTVLEERAIAPRVPEAAPETHRYRERPVELPVTPLSDTAVRERPPTSLGQIAERSVRQLLVFAILISTIVLVSAAVGVLVGRWMAQP
jgi:hypothetical protein